MNDSEKEMQQVAACEKTSQEVSDDAPLLLRQQLQEEWRELETQKAAFAMERLERSVRQELKNRKLPEQMSSLLTTADEAQCLERVEQFHTIFQQALTTALQEKMRGVGAPVEPVKPVSYSRDTLKGMSPAEINAHWEEIMRTLTH